MVPVLLHDFFNHKFFCSKMKKTTSVCVGCYGDRGRWTIVNARALRQFESINEVDCSPVQHAHCARRTKAVPRRYGFQLKN